MKKLLLFLMLFVTSIASWAEDPYFEVISGSFASGDVTLKLTFPGATTVSLKDNDIYAWLYNGSEYIAAATNRYGSTVVVTEGNTITVSYPYFVPNGDEIKYKVNFTSSDILVDGVNASSSFSFDVYSKAAMPFAEALSGSLTSGTLSVKVTFPTISSVFSDVGERYTVSLWNNGEKLDAKTKKSDVVVDGNTISMAYTFIPQSSDDLSSAVIKIDQSTFQFDGAWNAAMEIPFKTSGDDTPDPSGCAHENLTRHDLVESTDQVQGHSAYDECDDCGACFATTDTEHENALTAADFLLPLDTDPINYFYIQNRDYAETKVIWMVEGISLEYSYDKENWFVSTGNDPLAAEGRIYYRASTSGNTFFGAIDAGSAFAVGNDFNCPRCVYNIGGDITTLLRSNGRVNALPEPSYLEEWNGEDFEPVLRGVFENFCKGDTYSMLSDISELVLPSTILTERCYRNMFATNPGIHSAGPIISAVTMAPHSCESMFEGTEGISELPPMIVETLADYSCSHMFAGCSNLTSVTMFPTTVAPHCCEMMFYDCINLATIPTLPATTLAVDCYNSMFYNCWAITQAPELPAPSLVDGCYVQMFYGCSNLNYIKVGLMTDWPVHITPSDGYGSSTYDYYCTRDWVAGVASNGTFNGASCLYKEYIPYGGLYSVVPQNWDSENPLTVPVTISSAGYSTFCYDRNWIIPQGTVGYIGYVDESGSFHFEKAYNPGDIVNSYRTSYETYEDNQRIQQWVCKAVVLKGVSGTYTVTLTDDFGDDSETLRENNQLYGSMHDFDLSQYRNWNDDYYGYISSDYYYYTLSLDKTGKNVGFYWMNSTGAPFVTKPYKAFLRVKKDMLSNVKKSFVFDSDETITGVYTVPTKAKKHTDNNIYDLSGRRVMNANAKGLYIINGKKVVK